MSIYIRGLACIFAGNIQNGEYPDYRLDGKDEFNLLNRDLLVGLKYKIWQVEPRGLR